MNVNDQTWNPNLINFNSSVSIGIPSFYVQQMFGQYRGDQLLYSTTKNVQNGAFAATYNSAGKFMVVYLVNYGLTDQILQIVLQNFTPASKADVYTLHSNSGQDINTLDDPTRVATQHTTISVSNSFSFRLSYMSVVILKIPSRL